jgi:transposase
MSVPGVGVLSALAYVSTVEDPPRFPRSRSVGAHLGLTPRQYQSVEVEAAGCGDTLTRTLMYEAAGVILHVALGRTVPLVKARARDRRLVNC